MHCIITKQLSPSTTKPTRIKASIYGGTITSRRPKEAANDQHAHGIVARKLLKKMGYNEDAFICASGALPTDDGYCFMVEYSEIYKG